MGGRGFDERSGAMLGCLLTSPWFTLGWPNVTFWSCISCAIDATTILLTILHFFLFIAVGAAVAVVGLAAYRVYASRKNTTSWAYLLVQMIPFWSSLSVFCQQVITAWHFLGSLFICTEALPASFSFAEAWVIILLIQQRNFFSNIQKILFIASSTDTWMQIFFWIKKLDSWQ